MTSSYDEYRPEDRPQLRADDVVWREVGDELVVLELSTSTYLTLNGTARHLWEGLAIGASVSELVDVLCSRYSISTEQANSDVKSFMTALAERELIVRNQ